MEDLKTRVKRITGGDSNITENANKASSQIPTMRDLVAGEISRDLSADFLSESIMDAHKSGFIHFHDLDYSPLFPQFNCMLVDLEEMLTNGFKMGNAEIETPKGIGTACAVTAQITAQVASHIYGGTSFDRIDEVLAPYVRKTYKKLLGKYLSRTKGDQKLSTTWARQDTEKATFDAFQGLEYEINTLHTSNGQTPFVTFGFGLGTSWEAKLVQQSILQVRREGLGKSKRTAIFPKLVYGVRKGVNFELGDPNYDIKQLALKCASERMYPDILNYDLLVERTGAYKAPMGCRSFLSNWEDENGEERYSGRNNLGVVSVNLPRLGVMAGGDIANFYARLDSVLNISYDALKARIARFDNVQAKVAPILYCEGALGVRMQPEDYVADLFKDGRASISLGYIGIHECVNAMFGDEPHIFDSTLKQEFAKNVVNYLKSKTQEWKEETGYGFSLYGTPSENLCGRFCRLDLEYFGEEVPGVTDKGYYTNSFHLDVQKKVSPFEKIDFESDFSIWSSGGFISYVEFPNMKNNLKALEEVWNYAYYRVPYFGTNTPVDYCGECHFSGEATATVNGFVCPVCGNRSSSLSVTRRVCGYLGQPNARGFNEGKMREVTLRIKHQEEEQH